MEVVCDFRPSQPPGKSCDSRGLMSRRKAGWSGSMSSIMEGWKYELLAFYLWLAKWERVEIDTEIWCWSWSRKGACSRKGKQQDIACSLFNGSSLSAFTRILLASFIFLQCAIWTTFSARRSVLHVVIVDAEGFINLSAESSIVLNPERHVS